MGWRESGAAIMNVVTKLSPERGHAAGCHMSTNTQHCVPVFEINVNTPQSITFASIS